MQNDNSIIKTCGKALEAFMKPIRENAPFIVVYFMLNNILVVLQTLHGKIVEPENFGDVFPIIGPLFIYFLQAYVLAAIITLSHRRWMKVLVYIIVFALATVRIFLMRVFGMEIGPLMLTILAETNGRESSEFISTYIFSLPTLGVLLTITTYALIAVALELVYNKFIIGKWHISHTIRTVVSLVFLAVFAVGIYSFIAFNNDLTSLIRSTDNGKNHISNSVSDPFSRIYSSLRYIISTSQAMNHEVDVTARMAQDNRCTFTDDSLNVVLVIGESYIKHHAQLYGYPLPTTPRMTAEQRAGRLFAFTDVCSPYSYTTEVVRNMLCTNSISAGEQWNNTPYVPAVFKRAGFNVLMWDNQKNDEIDAEWTFTLNSFLFNDELSRLSYNQTNEKSFQYDGELLSSFRKEAHTSSRRNFIVFHLMGQHSGWSKRYPNTKEYERFTIKDVPNHAPWLNDAKRQEIADYDNATLYNDRIMGEIFDMFANKNTVVVYVPDHGEEVFDWRDAEGRNAEPMCANLLKYQYEVPFIVWCSNKYIEAHRDIISALKGSLNRAFETDNTSQPLFRLAGMSTPYYHADRDLTSPKYVKPRRIVAGNIDYDAVRWQRK